MENKITRLLHLYLSGRFSPETEERVQQWIINDRHAGEKENASFIWWNEQRPHPSRKTYTALKRVNQRIGFPQKRKLHISLYKRHMRIAAIALLLFLGGGGYLYHLHTRDIYTEITATYGKQEYTLLPDGSEVWLNSGTTIRYPKRFKSDSRKVQLKGEACFSVKEDRTKPFIVQAEHLTVKVLGTIFNVKAYPGEAHTTATLASGKVEIDTQNGQSHVLAPGEQFILNNRTAQINIREQIAGEASAWKEGHLIFDNATLTEIVRTLERRFNLTAETAFNDSGEQYTIKFQRNESLAEIVDIVSEISGYTIGLQGNKITIDRE